MLRKKKKNQTLTTSLSKSTVQKNRRNILLLWSLLTIIILFPGAIRCRLLDIPLERDEGEYAYAGQLILQGVPPYQEVYNMKLPGIYGIYAVLLAVFGQTHQGIHAGLMIVNSITIILVFLLARSLLNVSGGIISAAVFAILSLNEKMLGFSANAEHFVIVFSVAGLAILINACNKKGFLSFFAAGICLGLGFIMKQHGIMFCFFAIVYTLVVHLVQRPVSWKRLINSILFLSTGMAAVVLCLLLIMLWTGVFSKFWFWTVEYARAYVSQLNLFQAVHLFLFNFSEIALSAPLFWTLSCFGFILIPFTRSICRSHKIFISLFGVFSFLSICPGFFFRSHYFILLIPCTAILCGAAVTLFSERLSRYHAGIPFIITLFSIGHSIYLQSNYLFRMTPFEVCRSNYWLNPFSESPQIAEFIRNHTTEEDTIGIFGSEPQICFYAHRRSASGYIYMYPLMETHQFAQKMQQSYIHEIEAKKPKYFVVVNVPPSWMKSENSNTSLFDWSSSYIGTHYELVGTVELFDEKTDFHWYPHVKWPLTSDYSVLIFERNTRQSSGEDDSLVQDTK